MAGSGDSGIHVQRSGLHSQTSIHNSFNPRNSLQDSDQLYYDWNSRVK